MTEHYTLLQIPPNTISTQKKLFHKYLLETNTLYICVHLQMVLGIQSDAFHPENSVEGIGLYSDINRQTSTLEFSDPLC
jgi:hypothetical protein